MADEPKTEAPPEEQQRRQPVEIDTTNAVTSYANFCRVTGTLEELLIDFGLTSSPSPEQGKVRIDQRIVLNYYNAKRLLSALAHSVQRHESIFGVLETDINKRVKSQQTPS